MEKADRKREMLNENDYEEDKHSLFEMGTINLLSSSNFTVDYDSVSACLSPRESNEAANALLRKNSRKKSSIYKANAGAELIELSGVNETTPLSLWAKIKKSTTQFKGVALCVFAAFLLSLSNVILRKSKWFSGSDHALVRYVISWVFLIIHMKRHNIKIFPKNNVKILLFRGFFGAFALITGYFAFMITSPSNVVTFLHTSIVITAFLSRILFKEKLTLAHFVAVILSFIGILLISKPTFLFPAKKLSSAINSSYLIENCKLNGSSTNTCLELIEKMSRVKANSPLNLYAGLGLAFCSACSFSVVFCLIKKLNNCKIHWATSTIFVCWFGIPFALTISCILAALRFTHINFSKEQNDLPMDLFYSSISAIISLVGQIALNFSLQHEDPTKIAITKTIDVLFSGLFQFIILQINMDFLNILGALSILLGASFVIFFKIAEKRYEIRKMRDKGNESQNGKKSMLLRIIFVKI